MNDDYQSQNEVAGEVATSAFSAITDSIIDTHSAVKVLSITVTAELVAFAMFYVSKDKVLDFLADPENEGFWLYGGIGVFLIGFLTVFAVYRLAANRWRHRGSHIYIWLASIAAGILNILVFFAMITLEMR